MNADEMSWLLRTIDEPEAAGRFIQSRYERGRKSRRQKPFDNVKVRGDSEFPRGNVGGLSAEISAFRQSNFCSACNPGL